MCLLQIKVKSRVVYGSALVSAALWVDCRTTPGPPLGPSFFL
uniref:Uncharacterized protein n=1 Tax=Anguilla anguilla TaxID=7936 RepID=A0A0E9S399_ANGAN